jgi:hypothetical protein
MSNAERLLTSIVHFLGEKMREASLTDDSRESLEGD